MAAMYQFNDIEAAKVSAKKADQLAEKAAGVCNVIKKFTAEISQLTNTFAVNTQVCNRFDQLESTVGDFIEPLKSISAKVNQLVKSSEEAMELSKKSMM